MYQGKRVVGVELMGGKGTRLWPWVEEGLRSKATYELAGMPLAYFNAKLAEKAEIPYLIAAVEFNKKEIKDRLDFDGFNFKRKPQFVAPRRKFFKKNEVATFRGTADAVLQCQGLQAVEQSDYVVVLPCDHLTNIDLPEFIDKAIFNAEHYGAVITTAAMEKETSEIAKNFGNPKGDENGMVTEWIEKPLQPISNLAGLGIYAGPTKEVMRAITEGGFDFGGDVLKYLKDRGQLYVHTFPAGKYYWNDIGKPSLLLKAGIDLIDGIEGIEVPFRKIESLDTQYGGRIKNCLVQDNGQPPIYGAVTDCVLGKRVVVDKGTKVGCSIVGENVNLKNSENHGREVIIRRSIIGENSIVSDTDLFTVGLGVNSTLHKCHVARGKGIRMHPYVNKTEETISTHVFRERELRELEDWQ
jgi:NDP-sugar pyrophosphorylase family protein